MTTTAHMPGWGEAIPRLRAATLGSDGAQAQGGMPTLILFFGTAAHPLVASALAAVQANRALFDDETATFYGVTVDPNDAPAERIAQQLPGIRYLLDYDRTISHQFDLIDADGAYSPCWLLADRTWRVVDRFELDEPDAAMAALRRLVNEDPGPDWAPVLMVPNVLEPEYCRTLIDLHRGAVTDRSAVMREIDGFTRNVFDADAKVRRDHMVPNGPLAEQIVARLAQRVGPMMQRSFQYRLTHVERFVIGCYDAAEGGHFRAHRDDTTSGTAHRQFAVTMNLNADEYEGGDLNFPEFGPRCYRAPTGGAIVFSCALLHRVTRVTKGRRYALLPFLFDEAGNALRKANAARIHAEPIYLDQTARSGTA